MRRRGGTRKAFIVLLVAAVCALVALVGMLVFLLVDLARLTGDGRMHYGLRAQEAARQETEVSVVTEDAPAAASSRTRTFATVTTRYILIGDSRTHGMNLATHISASDYFDVIAESNMGYHWLVSTALPQASYLGCNNYVSLLGINDLTMIDSYLSVYRDLVERGISLTLVTVGPVNEGYGQYTVTNDEIAAFNRRLYEVEGARVIDLYAYMMEAGYRTMDGVHYDDDSYFIIEEFLLTELD